MSRIAGFFNTEGNRPDCRILYSRGYEKMLVCNKASCELKEAGALAELAENSLIQFTSSGTISRQIPFVADVDPVEAFSDIHLQEDIFSFIDSLPEHAVYAFALRLEDKVYLARDPVGIKPLWYYRAGPGLMFASEKKLLPYGCKELNPGQILCYDIDTDGMTFYNREFISSLTEMELSEEVIQNELLELLTEAVRVRLPDTKFGILFSGGVDSTLLTLLCKKLAGNNFTCYTVGQSGAPDIDHAKKIAELHGFKHVVTEISQEQIREYLKVVVPLIEEPSVPKVGVALTMYAACLAAKKDGVDVLFVGAGADELFAGYDRYKRSENINQDCYRDIMEMFEKNTYRDDVIADHTGTIMRLPYLDTRVIRYSLQIPSIYKISSGQNKLLLRALAEELGLPAEFAQRNKKAAQYGSRFDMAIKKLTKEAGMTRKTDYLKEFMMPLGVLFSSGKDSNYAMYKMQETGYPIKCLITLKSKNPDSYMFHTPNIDLAHLQAQAMDMPLLEYFTAGEKELELEDLEAALSDAKEKYQLEGIVTGALYSTYQKDRIERICEKLGLKVFSPLWHIDQEQEMRELLELGFEFIFSSIAAYGLDSSWVGRQITSEDVDGLVKLNEKIGLNIAGEGGEFESYVTFAPMYKKRIKINSFRLIERDEYTANVVIEDAELV